MADQVALVAELNAVRNFQKSMLFMDYLPSPQDSARGVASARGSGVAGSHPEEAAPQAEANLQAKRCNAQGLTTAKKVFKRLKLPKRRMSFSRDPVTSITCRLVSLVSSMTATTL